VVPLSTPLTEAQVNEYGIADHKYNYVRIDTLKVNFQPQPDRAIWFRLVPVQMRGDFTVVAAERWYPPAPQPQRIRALPDELFAIVNKGLGDGEYYTQHHIKNGNDNSRWFGHQVMDVMGVDEKQAKDYIKAWLKNRFLREDRYISPLTRRDRARVMAPTDQGRNG
jgi:hypothetical protein